MKKHILIADDDPHIRDVVEFALDSAGFSTATCGNGALALALFQKTPPDLIVLDVGMPEMDGLAVCREIRKTSECPILFLSARDEEVDRILGLEMGGDDYVTKPFSARELVARTNIILRRTTAKLSTELEDKALRHGMVWLEQASRSARVGDSDLPLTGTEFNILKLLIQRPGFVYSRTDILDRHSPYDRCRSPRLGDFGLPSNTGRRPRRKRRSA